MFLNETDRKHLNELYARAYKKYFAYTSTIGMGEMLGYSEAIEAARDELERYNTAMRTEIENKFADRVNAINTEAGKRGLITSTIVLQQLEKAAYEKGLMLLKFETVSDAKVRTLARKMLSDNMTQIRLSLTADKNSLDMHNKSSMTQTEKQKAVDEEVYGEYLRWLLSINPDVALSYVTDDPLFYYNLSATYLTKLTTEMQARGVLI